MLSISPINCVREVVYCIVVDEFKKDTEGVRSDCNVTQYSLGQRI